MGMKTAREALALLGRWLLRRTPAPQSAAGAVRTDPMLGKVLGRYRLMQKLGSGGMASVYRAMPVDAGSGPMMPVAVKVVDPGLGADAVFKGRFEREARVGSELRHPAIVRVLEFGEAEGLLYLVMDLVPGETLRQRIRPDMPLDEATGYLRQLLDGMAYAHAHGCLHRDLKPGNVMVTPGNSIKILDFGLVKRHDFVTLTRTGQVLGTVGYVAPEQVAGQPGDERTDQYALGVIAYELLTGRNPFKGRMTAMVAGTAEPPPVASVRADVSQSLSDTVRRMMAADAAARFPSLAEVRGALEGLAA
jgi:serine/threonine protein kinase